MHRRRWRIAAAVVCIVVLLILGLFEISRARCYQLIGTPVCHVATDRKIVALTFDDGPTPDGVAALVPILKRYDAQATFFLIGRDIAQHPGLVRRLLASGNEVGNHSYTHQRMWGFLPGAYESEIRRTDLLLRGEGASPLFFRPPYGKKLTGLPIAVSRTGYRMITWDIEDPDDAPDAASYARRVVAQVRPGSIILMHPMYRNRIARDAVPLILTGLIARGYRVVTVGTLLASTTAATAK